MTGYVTYMNKHLKTCKFYLKDSTNASLWIIDKYNQEKQKTGIHNFISIRRVKEQTRLKIPILSQTKQDIRNCMAAITLYKTGKRFSNFKNKGFNTFLYWFNLVFKILNIRQFSRKLIEETHDITKSHIQVVFDKCIYFNFVHHGSLLNHMTVL